MNTRFFTVLAVLVSLALWQVLRAELPKEQRPAAPVDSLEARYSQAQLRLAEANLDRVQRINARLAKTISRDVVTEYQQEVEVASQQAKAGGAGNASALDVWLARAAADARSTEAFWKSASAANRRVPGTIDPLDIERLRLRAEVARLELARGKAVVLAPKAAQLEWQLALVNGQLQRLREDVLRSPPTNHRNLFFVY